MDVQLFGKTTPHRHLASNYLSSLPKTHVGSSVLSYVLVEHVFRLSNEWICAFFCYGQQIEHLELLLPGSFESHLSSRPWWDFWTDVKHKERRYIGGYGLYQIDSPELDVFIHGRHMGCECLPFLCFKSCSFQGTIAFYSFPQVQSASWMRGKPLHRAFNSPVDPVLHLDGLLLQQNI